MKRKLIHLCAGLCVYFALIILAAAAMIIEPMFFAVLVAQLAFPLVSVAILSIICIVDAVIMLIRSDEMYSDRAFLLILRSKLCNTPFFILNILMWLLVVPATFNPFLMWVWLFVPLAIVYAYMLLLATSSYAIAHLIFLCRKGEISKRTCVLHIFLQLIFVVDVIDIFLLRRMEKRLAKQSMEQEAVHSEAVHSEAVISDPVFSIPAVSIPVASPPAPMRPRRRLFLTHEILFSYLFLIPLLASVIGYNSGFSALFLPQAVWPNFVFTVMSILCIVDAIRTARKDNDAGSRDRLIRRTLFVKILSIPWYAGMIYLGIRIVQLPSNPDILVVILLLLVFLALNIYVHLLATSSYGFTYLHILRKEGKMKRRTCLGHSLLLLIPVADVVETIVLAKRKN